MNPKSVPSWELGACVNTD